MTGPGQQTPHTLSKDDKMVDQVKAQLVKDFVLAVVVCDHASGPSKRMVVSCWPECQPCCGFDGYWHPHRALTLEPEPYADVD